MLHYLKFFLIGAIENFLSGVHSKFFQRSKIIASVILDFINIIIWYTVLVAILDSINKFQIILSYALGYALGDYLSIIFDNYLDKLAKRKGFKFWLKKKHKRRKR